MRHADYIERRRHGSPAFPIQLYHIDRGHPRYIMHAHWHKEFEIIKVQKGNLRLFLDNTEYLLEAGDILLAPGRCLHRGEPEECVYECLVFDPSMLIRQQSDAAEKYLLPIINSTADITPLKHSGDSSFGETVGTLFSEMRDKKPCYELQIYSLLFSVFSQLFASDCISPASSLRHSHTEEAVSTLIGWIEGHFTEPVTLEKLSAISGFSKKYLCRIFKEYTSKTVIEYVTELRIENACYEISEKGKSITRAAFDSGFNDLSYFCRIFKKYKGMTPKEYRKSLEK